MARKVPKTISDEQMDDLERRSRPSGGPMDEVRRMQAYLRQQRKAKQS